MHKIFLKVIFCIFLISLPILAVHESPIQIVKILFTSGFGNANDFSLTLLYFAPLLLAATSVQLAFSNGLYNIGSEGQLYMGASFGIAAGIFFTHHGQGDASPLLTSFALFCCFMACFLGGAFWGAVVGFFRAYKNVHEVITSILLNFIAYAFSNWIVLRVFKNEETQASETLEIAKNLQIPLFWKQAPSSVFLATVLCILLILFLQKTWGGFRVRAVGLNPLASQEAGISSKRNTLFVMFFSGGISGLIGFHEIFCHSYKLIDGYSLGFGFTGLAIALASQGSFFSLIGFSFLFALLSKGSLDLEIETQNITRDLSLLIQALILVTLSIPTDYFFRKKRS